MHELALTMKHDGQRLEGLLEDLGVKKSQLADALGKNANTITRWFKKSELSGELLVEIGKALRYDVSQVFPKLKKIPEASALNYFNSDPDQLLSRVTEVESRFSELVETKEQISKENLFLQETIKSLRELIATKNQIIDMQSAEIKRLKGN